MIRPPAATAIPIAIRLRHSCRASPHQPLVFSRAPNERGRTQLSPFATRSLAGTGLLCPCPAAKSAYRGSIVRSTPPIRAWTNSRWAVFVSVVERSWT